MDVGRRVHEGRVETGADQRVEVGVELGGRQVEGVADAGQRGRGAGLQMELHAGLNGEHRR